jgi:hypothetical protein
MTADTRLSFLADRIPVSLGEIDLADLPAPMKGLLHLINAPITREHIVSIGDLFIWAGAFIVMPTFAVLFPRFAYLIFCFVLYLREKRKRGRSGPNK